MRRSLNWFNSKASPEPAEPAGPHRSNNCNHHRTWPLASDSDSPSSLNHSSSRSPSPTPQPPTPSEPVLGHLNIPGSAAAAAAAAVAAKPIAIAATPARHISAPVSSRLDHLDFAHDDALAGFSDAHCVARPASTSLFDFETATDLGIDTDMTTGPNFDSAAGRSRQDSFVSAKPISMSNPNREHANRGRRESLAGSMMAGMSWGGISVGSFIREE